jgi:hypothetical protein
MIPASRNLRIRFQTGVLEDPTFRAISSNDWLASRCSSARIFRSISSGRTDIFNPLTLLEQLYQKYLDKEHMFLFNFSYGILAENNSIFQL